MATIQIRIPTVETVPISTLKTDSENPNKMSRQQLDRLKKSIQTFGFIVPIVTNKDLLIADGEQRWICAYELGMKEVSVIRLPVEDVDRRLLRQVLNKLRGEHELTADALEFEKIIALGKEDDLKYLLDLNDSKLERYLREIHPPNPEDYEIPEIGKVKTDIKRGEVFSLGNHRLMCGDATTLDVDKLMENVICDLFITDPPYGVSYADKNVFLNAVWPANRVEEEITNDGLTISQMKSLWLLAFKNALNHSRKGAIYYINAPQGGELMMMMMMTILEAGWQLKHTLIWKKNNIVMGRSDYKYQHEPILYGWKDGSHSFYGLAGCSSVWEIPKPHNSDLHPTMKPIKLIETELFNSSVEGETVLDLFGGSGSTLIACEQTGRGCYMMEIEPRYCQIIINRWEKYTGQKAVKLVESDNIDVQQADNTKDN